jgi:hypothetical protein
MGKTKDGEPTSFNLLDEFYRAPERYAYTFQNYVFYTRFLQVSPPFTSSAEQLFCNTHLVFLTFSTVLVPRSKSRAMKTPRCG